MSTTTMTGINTAQHIVQSSNSPVRADEDNEDSLIDPKAVVELREIETRMVRQVYERSVSFVAGLFFPSAESEAGSGSREWNETNPDPPLDISSLFPSNKSETNDSEGSSTPNHQLSIPSYYHCFPPDRSDTDSYRSSTPMQFSIPSLPFPPNKSETINVISLNERTLGGIKMHKRIEVDNILQSNSLRDLMFRGTDDHEEMNFNGTLRTFDSDQIAEAMEQLGDKYVIYKIVTGLRDVANMTIKPQFLKRTKHKNDIIQLWESHHSYLTMPLYDSNCLDWSNETWKLMESGDIHPLTETVMNYMKWIGDYSDTRNLFKIGEDDDQLDALRNHDSNSLKMKPVAGQLLLVVNILESNLEKNSKLYADSALRCIFLMNNILYMKQKVKDSGLGGLLGDNWVRTRLGQIRQYAMSYLKASWTKVLDCLNDRGTPWSSSSKASTVALQERLKNFNACFEEICRVQTDWIVPDAQLREELRISIKETVIPAYHSFMGRFGNQVESGGHAEQCIKYTADNLESYLFNLFKGVPRVLHRRRRKSK